MTTIIETVLHMGRMRPWAYEIPATFTDDEGKDYNSVLVFKAGAPTQVEIDGMVAMHVARIEAVKEEVEIEPEL